MGLSVLLPVLLSVVLTLIFVLIIRYFDKKSNSVNEAYQKIRRFTNERIKDIKKEIESNTEAVEAQFGEFDLKYAKGEGLIYKLGEFSSDLESLELAKEEINKYSQKLESMSKHIECLESVLNDIQNSEPYLKNVVAF